MSERHSLSKERQFNIEIDRASEGTHGLKKPKGKSIQDTETNRASEGHQRTGEIRGRDQSGHGNEQRK
jgi:hypothetical protein